MKEISSEPSFHNFLEAIPDALIIVGPDEAICHINSETERLFGYSRDQLVGQSIDKLIPPQHRLRHRERCSQYFSAPSARMMGSDQYGLRSDGVQFPAEISLSPLRARNNQLYVITIIRNITERKLAEASLRHSLNEKEILLKEVHHRVKNNLQVISSILNLQSSMTTDKTARAILLDTQARVRSMALLHEQLYKSSDLINIDFKEYVNDLVRDLVLSFGDASRNINIIPDIKPIKLPLDKLVNCGLIINELVSNSLKYAFQLSKNKDRQIMVSFNDTATALVLTVSDNGSGLPIDFEQKKAKTLGLKLVSGLARELGGEMSIESRKGVKFIITFPQ